MAILDEDIFGGETLKLVLRYNPKVSELFNKINRSYTFETFVNLLNGKERKCYFMRKDDTEDKIVIPISDEGYGGQLELVVAWNGAKFCYEIKVNKNKKSRYNSIVTSIDNTFMIERNCEFIFLDLETPYTDLESLGELQGLNKKVRSLEIAPQTKIENERELWTKYIYAQKLQIEELQKPFECIGVPKLESFKNTKGEINRYKITVPIKELVQRNAYVTLEEEYRKEFDRDFRIATSTGVSTLTRKQIENVDVILQRKLKDKYERKSEIGCVLKIAPLKFSKYLYYKLKKEYSVDIDDGDLCISETVNTSKKTNNAIIPRIPQVINNKYNLRICGVFCLYERVDEYGNRHTYVKKIKREIRGIQYVKILIENTERQARIDEEKWLKSGDCESVSHTLGCIYSYNDNYEKYCFSADYWNDLKREFYGLDYNFSSEQEIVSFNFSKFEQLEEKCKMLRRMQMFKFVRDPLKMEDFGFKVTFQPLDSNGELPFNRREKLKNVAFVAEIENKSGNQKKLIQIGTLRGYESTDTKLVFSLPYVYKDEKKIAKDVVSYLSGEEKKPFINVHADLRGDWAKISWLEVAINKLNESALSSTKANAKPINLRLRDYIFDSSKARATHKFELNEITDTEEYRHVRDHQLLKLNDSQLLSVTRALYAQDMCLLQGPPGTGKTTVIAELIWQHILLNSRSRILLTSETNLAVDNALEKLMNSRNVSSELSRYLTIIKPLRFGRSDKFEQEGKRYSFERIERWLDEDYEEEFQYENDQELGVEDVEEDGEEKQENLSVNAVQDWMKKIADRSNWRDDRYSEVLKDYQLELSNPATQTKRYFKDKYFRYVNVVGSTCSSTGSRKFAMDYAKIFSSDRYDDYIRTGKYKETISEIQNWKKSQNNLEDSWRSALGERIIRNITKQNNIKDDELDDLLKNPTDNFKHYLFEYELNNLFHESSKNEKKPRFNTLLERLNFQKVDDYERFLTINFDTIINYG